MSKFSQIARGLDQIDEVQLALPGASEPAKVGVRPLLAEDDDIILTEARKFAAARGVSEPKGGDPIYDLGLAIHTLARGCVDLESKDKAEPFFDGGAEQIRKELDRDRIAYLYARQQAWQDKCAPLPKQMNAAEFIQKVFEIAEVAEDDDRPFDSLRPALLVSFTRTLAKQFVTLATLKSPSGSDSSANTSSNTKSPEP